MGIIVVLSPAMLLGDTCFRGHWRKCVWGGVAAALGFLASCRGTAYTPPQRLQKVRVDVDMNLEELLVIM